MGVKMSGNPNGLDCRWRSLAYGWAVEQELGSKTYWDAQMTLKRHVADSEWRAAREVIAKAKHGPALLKMLKATS